MGFIAPASPNNTFYCGNVTSRFNRHGTLGSFLICVAVLLISVGLLILLQLIPEGFFKVCECMYYIKEIVNRVCCVPISGALFAIVPFTVIIISSKAIGGTQYCNTGFLVMYFWVFAEMVIVFLLIELAIILVIISYVYRRLCNISGDS